MGNQNILRNDKNQAEERLSRKSLWVAVAGGGALAVFGASRKTLAGVSLAAIGGLMVLSGARSLRNSPRRLYVHQSLHINQPVEKLYSFWRNFDNLPGFMQHVKSVRTTGTRFSHWVVTGPMNTTFSWDAEISAERENEYIVWRSLPGSTITNRGSIEFRNARGHEGSEIHVTIQYDAPGGRAGEAFASIFGENPEQQVRADLRRFKQLMETGEIPTTTGQSSGRRSPWVRMMQSAETEREATQVNEPKGNLA